MKTASHKWITAALAAVILCSPFQGPSFVRAEMVEGREAIGSPQDAALIATLIRSSLISLHLAMVSDNYSVLRDLAAPTFRDRYSLVDFARIFQPIRDRGINLEAVAVLAPNLEAAVIDNNDLLRIVGTFETDPVPVRFELAFQIVNQSWAMFGIRVEPLEALADTMVEREGLPIPTPRPET